MTDKTVSVPQPDPINDLAELLDINIWYRHHAACPTCGIELRKLPPESNLIPHWEGRCNG